MKRLILISACFAVTSAAFAQQECVKTTVSVSGNQMTLTTSGAKSVTGHQNFVYYEKKRLRKRDKTYNVPGVAQDRFASAPLLLNSWEDVKPVPEKYNVSVATPDANITACHDSEANVTAMLNVERVASYTGNFPANQSAPAYHKVKKRHYKMAVRKMKKIERKQEKIARKADVHVEVRSTKA